jgi:hypothetical protein
MHERQVQAVLFPLLELLQRTLVALESLPPDLLARARRLGKLLDQREGERLGRGGGRGGWGEEGGDSVVEVREGEEGAGGEGVEKGGLVDAVEGARLDFADAGRSTRGKGKRLVRLRFLFVTEG